MAIIVWLRHPWYDPDGYYRRVEDNPHTVNLDLAVIPSSAEVENPSTHKRDKVWELRGEENPATRAESAGLDAEARKMLPLARALHDPKGALKDADALEKENEKLKKDLEALTKKYEVDPPKLPDKTPP